MSTYEIIRAAGRKLADRGPDERIETAHGPADKITVSDGSDSYTVIWPDCAQEAHDPLISCQLDD